MYVLDLQGSLKRQDCNGSADGIVFLGHNERKSEGADSFSGEAEWSAGGRDSYHPL